MTETEAIGRIRDLTGMTDADVVGLRACTYDELVELVRAYRNSGQVPSQSAWVKVADVLGQISHYAGIAAPLLAAAEAVFAL